jgi:hypothetical protein
MDKGFVSLRGGRSVPDEAISLPIWGLRRREERGSQRHNLLFAYP